MIRLIITLFALVSGLTVESVAPAAVARPCVVRLVATPAAMVASSARAAHRPSPGRLLAPRGVAVVNDAPVTLTDTVRLKADIARE